MLLFESNLALVWAGVHMQELAVEQPQHSALLVEGHLYKTGMYAKTDKNKARLLDIPAW
jgi:hypothetical protein